MSGVVFYPHLTIEDRGLGPSCGSLFQIIETYINEDLTVVMLNSFPES